MYAGRHDGEEHRRPAHARRRVDGHGQDLGARAQRELPAGRPARVGRRRQLGVGAHDLRRRQPRLRVHLRGQRQPAQRGGRQARRHPGGRPLDYYVRIISDGDEPDRVVLVRRRHVPPVGRPAPLATFTDPKIGPAALSRRLRPCRSRASTGSASTRTRRRRWRRRRRHDRRRLRRHRRSAPLGAHPPRPDAAVVGGGTLQIPARPGDIYQTRNDAKNLIVRDRADGCLEGHHEDQLRGHRPVPPGRDHGLRRRRQLHEVRPHRAQRGRRREVRVHQRGQRGRRATRRPTRPPTSRRPSRTTTSCG